MLDYESKNTEVIKIQKLNCYDFLKKLSKCLIILEKDKAWNVFKNMDSDGTDYINSNDAKSGLKEKYGKVLVF